MKTIDARGYSCPEPVMMAMRGTQDKSSDVAVLVDTHVSKENVSRFLSDAGFTVTVNEKADHFEVLAKKA